MSCVFGIANHSPEAVVKALLKSKIAHSPAEIGIVSVGAHADTSFRFILFLTQTDLFRNAIRLSRSEAFAFVFSNSIDLANVKGLQPLDFTPMEDFTFTYHPLNMHQIHKRAPGRVTRVENKFLSRLINQVRHGSLLNPLMTFIYGLSSPNQQLVKEDVVAFLYYNRSITSFRKGLAKVLTVKAISKLEEIILTHIGEAYIAAFAEIRASKKANHPYDIKTIARKTGTTPYEISYMMSIIETKKKYLDSFDKAKNRRRP